MPGEVFGALAVRDVATFGAGLAPRPRAFAAPRIRVLELLLFPRFATTPASTNARHLERAVLLILALGQGSPALAHEWWPEHGGARRTPAPRRAWLSRRHAVLRRSPTTHRLTLCSGARRTPAPRRAWLSRRHAA